MRTPFQLIDRTGQVVAQLSNMRVDERSSAYIGKLTWRSAPTALPMLLAELETLVEGQIFRSVDAVQDKIDGIDLLVIFQEGGQSSVRDLYVSSTGGVSFRL